LARDLTLALHLYAAKLGGAALIALTALSTVGAEAHLHAEVLRVIAVIVTLTRLAQLVLVGSAQQQDVGR